VCLPRMYMLPRGAAGRAQTESGINHEKLRKMIAAGDARVILNLNQLRKVDPELTYGCVPPSRSQQPWSSSRLPHSLLLHPTPGRCLTDRTITMHARVRLLATSDPLATPNPTSRALTHHPPSSSHRATHRAHAEC